MAWLAAVGIGLSLGAGPRADAATRTWTGTAIGNNTWINITNWGLTPPANGDSLFFPFSAGNKSSINNLGVTNYQTIFFAGSNYTFSGGTIGLSGGIVATNNGTNTFVTPLLLRAGQSISSSNFAGALQFAGGINLNGNNLNFDGDGDVRIVAPITGAGEIVKRGFGDLFLQSASTYSGTTYLALASLYVRHPLALGDTNFPLVVTNLTRRVFLGTNIFVTNKSLLLGRQSELWGEGGTNGWMGPIGLTGSDPFLRLDNGGRLLLGGSITGSPTWHIVGPGTVVLEGAGTNTAGGDWNLNSGVTVLQNKPPGQPSSHRYVIAEGSTVRLLASDQLSDSRSLILSDGTLDLNGFSDRIVFYTDSSTNGSGRILFGSSGTNALTFGSTSTTSIFSGMLTGAGDLVKIGGSTHILRGTNSSTGDTIINGNGSVLAVDGRINGPTLVTNGMLTGTGRVASVTLGGATAVLNPGLGTNSTARLILGGASSWLAGRVQLELNGLTPGTQHDVIQLDAAIALTNCGLQVTLGFAPALGNSFVIVTNTTAGPINGIFAGLPEGAVLNAGGTLLRISYLGGTGNDIMLTVVNGVASGVTRQWSGAGANNFWLTAANWIGGTRPTGGDSLYFPPGAPRLLNTNDFPPLFLNSILVGGAGYDLRGGGLTLLNGLTATNPSGAVFVRTPLALGTNQGITQTTPLGTLNLPAPIDLGPHALTINATNSILTSGTLLGSGTLTKTGPGQLFIGGTNAITGTNFIEDGIFFVDGAIPTARVRLGTNATLNGIGYIGRVQSFGTIAPAEAGGQGALTFGDDVRLASGSTARFKLEGDYPGGFDQMVMTNSGGLFAISNATLVIQPTGTLVVGSAFTVIDKAGAADVVGAFNGLPEGATFTAGNYFCSITYQGGDGNDVVVTITGIAPTGVTRTWTGGGTNAFWQTAANWGGVVPMPGDSLEFPVVAARKVNTNDFPAGTFNQIRVAGGYELSGSNVTMLGGILAENGLSRVTAPLALSFDQTFTADAGDTLVVVSVQLGPRTLTLASQAGAFLAVDGVVTGSGNIIKSGPGVWALNGTNNSPGTNFINAGELRAHGVISTGRVVAATGSVVSGSGHVHRLASSGRVKPGEDSEGALSIGSELRLTNGAVLAFEWPATTPAGGFNKVVVTNDAATVIVSNATLEINFISPPVPGSNYTVIDKAGAAPVLGTFAGLPEDTVFSVSNVLCRITYAGGSGNDVVVTVLYTGATGVERVWTGGGFPNTKWSNPANWSGGAAPVSGDALVFPGGASGKTNFHDLGAAFVAQSLRFATGACNFQISGGTSLLLASGLVCTNATQTPTLLVPVRLLAAQTFENHVVGPSVALGPIQTDGYELTLLSPPGAGFTASGVVSGGGSLRKRGGGNLNLTAANTYTGLTVVEAGTATAANNLAFGAIGFGTVVSNGATVSMGLLNLAVPEPLTLAGTLASGIISNSTWAGPVTLTGPTATLLADTNPVSGQLMLLQLTGPLSGAAGFTKIGAGRVALMASNSFSGDVMVGAGTLLLGHVAALGASGGVNTVGSGARLELAANLPPISGESLQLAGTLAVQAHATNHVWNGGLTLTSPTAAIETQPTGGDSSRLEIPGLIQGNGGLVKTGPGTLVLGADNTYLGLTRVGVGTLLVNGNQIDSSVVVSNNATLGGDGQCGSVTSLGGVLAPEARSTNGILRAAGGATLDAASRFRVEVSGAGSADQLRVFGSVDLGGAALELVPLSEPSVGAGYEILRNDGIDPILGTFAGLANNAVFNRAGYQWQISYTGGDGNDIVVTPLGFAPSGLVREWNGNGLPNTNWSLAANWVGNSVPVGGDDLFFPGTIDNQRKTNFYDLPGGSLFRRLWFGDGQARYRIFGATPLRLLDGIVVTNAAFGPSFSVPLQLIFSQTFSNTGAGGLRVQDVSLGVNQLAFDGAGSFIVEGTISGAGGLTKRGSGPLRLNGASTFTGAVSVEAGVVELNNNAALGDAGAGTTVSEGARLIFSNGGRSVAEPLALAGTLGGSNFTGNTWTGPIALVAPDAVFDMLAGGEMSVASAISGNATLQKTGGGSLVMTGTNTFTGPTLVQGGTLRADGLHTNSAITVITNATLGGTGLVASVTANGGRLSPATTGTAGRLQIAGNLELNAASALLLDIGGLTPGSGHDQIIVASNLTLAGAPPFVSTTFVPGPSDSIVILRKDSPGPVSGTFLGVPQNGTFSGGTFIWRVNYAGGDGNDVALTLAGTNAPGATTSVWSGGAAPDGNWSSPANWTDNLPPQIGAHLIFPGTVAFKSMTNDFPPAAFFNHLRFATGSCSFTVRGTPLKLYGGVTLTNATFGPFFLLNSALEMQAPQTFESHDASLSLPALNNGGFEATFVTTTNIYLDVLSGAGGVRKRGPGTMTFFNTNSYSGATVIEEGTVELHRTNGLGAVSAGTTVAAGATLTLVFTGVSATEPLNLAGTMTLLLNSQDSTWTGPVTLASSTATFDSIFFASTLRVTGLITGGGGLRKTGAGTLRLGADNNYSGPTFVEAGTLIISNSHLPGMVTVDGSNTVLQAVGAVGGLASTNAQLNAGVGTASALLDVNGPLTLDAGTRFNVDMNGPAAGTGFDQWRVSGPVNLGNATLVLPIRFVPSVGASFIIIRKDSAGAVNGTFAGFPEGTVFTRGAFDWRLSYTGGDGNDVTLTVVSQRLAGFVWDGGGANSNWTTAANWLGDAAPAAGADLIFPAEAANRTNFNAFPPGTGFNSIRYNGATSASGLRHIALGNALVVTNGLTCESNAGQMTFGAPLTVVGEGPAGGGQITVVSPATLTLTGLVASAGFDLALAGSGTLTFSTPIDSDGGLVSSAGFVLLRSNNTFAASSLIATGTVRFDANGAFGDAANSVTVESPARLQLQGADNVANPLVLRGSLEALRTNTWSGPILAEGTNAVITWTSSGAFSIDGNIAGNGELTLLGGFSGAPLLLNGTDTYTGLTRLSSGTLFVNGSHAGGALHLATSQTFAPTLLGGTGTVGSVFAGGKIAPGFPTNAGILSVAGNFTLSNNAVLAVRINGPDAGVDYDQLRVSGGVTIDNATLVVSQLPAFLPAVGASFVILRKDGPGPITGSFAGLPPGGFVTNCAVFQITYTGGDGNDVALTVTARKGTVNLWTGAGGDSNWSNGANWLCGLPPDPGDTLVFSNGIPNLIAFNDYPAGTTFGRLAFLGFSFGQAFFLGGNPLTLTDGIEGYFGGSNVLSMLITLAGSQTFSNASGQLVFRGGLENAGNTLNLAGGGTFDFVGPYSGAGGLTWTNTAPFSFGFLYLRTNNPFSGPIAMDGLLALAASHPGALGEGTGGLFIGSNVQCLVQVPTAINRAVTLAGRLDFNTGVNALNGPLTIVGPNVLMCIAGTRMDFNGPIHGSGEVQLCGISTNFFNGGGTFDGVFETFTGQQIFLGDFPNARIVNYGTVNFSSTLAGSGRVGGIVASDAGTNSIIAPGVSGPGILSIAGPLTIESNITLQLQINGPTPGAGYDQLIVAGPIALTNCTLELNLGFIPGPGDSFVLIDNTGPGAIAGTFDGLPEGTLFPVGASELELTYTGGDGNDVVLRPTVAPSSTFTSVVCLPDGTKQFQIIGQPNATYVLEATTNLLLPPALTPWVFIGTNTANGLGVLQFIDLDSTNFLQRFYRIRSQ